MSEIDTVQLKKYPVCALPSCGKPITEGTGYDFGNDLYTHDLCKEEYGLGRAILSRRVLVTKRVRFEYEPTSASDPPPSESPSD